MLLRLTPGRPTVTTALCCAVCVVTSAQEATAQSRKAYNLPGGDAASTLKRFAADSGEQIVYLVDNVRGETTKPVVGTFAAREALDRMLAGTALFVSQDSATGALVVGRTRPPPTQDKPTEPSPSPRTSTMLKPSVLTRAAAWLAALAVPLAEGQTARPATPPAEAVQLSTFTVREEQDIGYESMQTTAGMRTVQELRNVANSISIMNSQLIEDTASLNIEEMSTWFVSGESNPEPGNNHGRVILRGIASAFAMRNGWIWYSPMDAFSTERVELLRGPNAFLYGEADVGGAINQVTKRGLLSRDITRVKALFESNEMRRGEIDINRRLVRDKLALRVAAVVQHNESWMDNVRRDMAGIYAAATYRPFRTTSISVMAEHVEAESVNAQGLFTDAFSRPTNTANIPANNGYIYIPATGLRYRPQAAGRFNSTGTATSIVDPSILPREFHSAGPNNTFYNFIQSVTIDVEQRIGKNLLLQVTGNFYNRKIDLFALGAGRNIFRDRNATLPGGAPNPYFNELYTEYFRLRQVIGNLVRDMRFAAVYDLKTRWTKQSLMLNLQQHQDNPGQKKPKWAEYVDPASPAWTGAQPSTAITQAAFVANRTLFTNNRFTRRFYFNRDGMRGSEDMGPVEGVSAWYPDLSNTIAASGQFIDRRFYTPSWGVGASGSWFKEHLFTHLGYREDRFNMKTTVGAVRPIKETWVIDEIPGAFAPNPTFVHAEVEGANAGAIVRINDSFAIGYNWAQSFRLSSGPVGNLTHRVGERQGVNVGEGEDISARFSLLRDTSGRHRLELTAVRYHNFRPNDRFNFNPDITVEDEVAAIFPTEFLASGQDYQTTTTEGYEFEVMANPTRNWRVTFNFATNKVVTENRAPVLKSFQSDAKAMNRPTPLLDAFLATIPEGVANPGYTKERANLFTRYTFSQGPLKGVYVGGGVNYRLRTFRGNADLDGIAATAPQAMWSPAYSLFSVLAGYRTKVFNRPTSFSLNVSNLTDKEYFRSSGIATGTWGEPRSFRLTVVTDF